MKLFLIIIFGLFGAICIMLLALLMYYQFSQPELTSTQITMKYWPLQLGLIVSYVVAYISYFASKNK